VTRTVAVTVDFVLNLTSLGENARVGGREVDLHTNVMPGLYLGVRFWAEASGFESVFQP
jgi:hypothetical protein